MDKKDERLRSFRLVAAKHLEPYIHLLLKTEGYAYEPEPFAANCFRLIAEPKPLGSSWAAFFGYIYIQDRSSMLPPVVLNPEEGATVLDMCASPGSKTSFLAQLVGPSGFVLANEAQTSRLFTLRQNLERLNLIQTATSCYQGQALDLQPESLSYIALDPPCSGWGTVQKNPQVLKLWRDSKVDPLIGLQRLLLSQAAKLLAPKGLLIYSTCTTNPKENEEQILFAQHELGLEIVPINPMPGFVFESNNIAPGTLTVNGASSKAQGFYLALLRKNASLTRDQDRTNLRNDQDAPQVFAKEALMANHKLDADQNLVPSSYLEHPSLDFSKLPNGVLRLQKNEVFFYPHVSLKLDIKFRPFKLGTLHGPKFTPAPRLRILAEKPNPATDLLVDDLEDLAKIFAGQSLKTTLKNGNALLWWQNLPLGFVQIKAGRILAQFR